MKIANEKWVTIHYTLKDDDGNQLDSSVGGVPLGFVYGRGYLITGLEKELAYTLRKTNPTVYTKTPQYFPKDEPKSGIEEILDRFK